MKKRLILACLVLLYAAVPAQAARRGIVADLSEDFVAVSEGFGGAHVTVFGVAKKNANVAIVLQGPVGDAKVREKTRQMGLWINGAPEELRDVPSFYAILTSNPVAQLLDDKATAQYGLALDALEPSGEKAQGFRRERQARDLYQELPQGVKILEGGLFRADIDLPASVPVGDYAVRIYEIAGGKILSSRDASMKVAQVGFGAAINALSHEHPVYYAMLALLMALVLAVGASRLVRRSS